MKTNAVMKDVLDADVLIAAPVAKTNTSTGVSLSLKGQMGLILDRNVMHWLYDLDTAIVDLGFRLKPALAVIDASRRPQHQRPLWAGQGADAGRNHRLRRPGRRRRHDGRLV